MDSWKDLTNPPAEKLEELASSMNALSTHIKDCLDPHHLPKLEVVGDTIFIIIRYLDPHADENALDTTALTRKIALFISPTQILTVHRAEVPFIKKLQDELKINLDKKNWDQFNIAIHIMKKCIDSYDPFLDKVESVLTETEGTIFARNIDENILLNMHNRKRQLYLIRKLLNLINITLRELTIPGKKYAPYVQDLKEVGTAQYIWADDLVDQSSTLIQTFITLSDWRSNQVMKILTMFSMFFLPLTFVVGIYGMNFHFMPEIDWKYGYLFVWLLMIVITISIYIFFKKKGWIR